MKNDDKTNSSNYVKRHGKHMLLYILTGLFSLTFFIIGWRLTVTSDPFGNVLINLGLALGPVSFLGIIYEWFLFDEIRAGAKEAFSTEVTEYLAPVLERMDIHTNKLIDNTDILTEIHKLGIVKAFRERNMAFDLILESMENEISEIFLVGTSLRGLLNEEVGDIRFQKLLKKKFDLLNCGELKVKIKILLTHPVFAYLRQDLEKLYSRKETFSIAQEIYNSVKDLKKLGLQKKIYSSSKERQLVLELKLVK